MLFRSMFSLASLTFSFVGDLVYISAMGKPIVVLNSYKVAYDLLVRRASIYSDRPRSVMVGEMWVQDLLVSCARSGRLITSYISMGFVKGVILGYYGENWRLQRKLIRQYMNKVSVRQFWPAMEQGSRTFVLRVLDDNE